MNSLVLQWKQLYYSGFAENIDIAEVLLAAVYTGSLYFWVIENALVVVLVLGFIEFTLIISFSIHLSAFAWKLIFSYSLSFFNKLIIFSSSFCLFNDFSYSWSWRINPKFGSTMNLFDFVKFKASYKLIPFSFIKYAMTQLELRDTPAKLKYECIKIILDITNAQESHSFRRLLW